MCMFLFRVSHTHNPSQNGSLYLLSHISPVAFCMYTHTRVRVRDDEHATAWNVHISIIISILFKEKLTFTGGNSQGVTLTDITERESEPDSRFEYHIRNYITYTGSQQRTLYWRLPGRFLGNKVVRLIVSLHLTYIFILDNRLWWTDVDRSAIQWIGCVSYWSACCDQR